MSPVFTRRPKVKEMVPFSTYLEGESRNRKKRKSPLSEDVEKGKGKGKHKTDPEASTRSSVPPIETSVGGSA